MKEIESWLLKNAVSWIPSKAGSSDRVSPYSDGIAADS